VRYLAKARVKLGQKEMFLAIVLLLLLVIDL
jgi:hypothetical protein